jgi:mannose-6-phosphate isomerase
MDPLVFALFFRQQVWGGRRFERYLGRPLPENETCGEAWVVSAQPLHVSRVCEGENEGRLLTDLWTSESASMIGPDRIAPPAFPLLVKYLDCQERLSIQVHPSDKDACQMHLGEHGKSEAWVVLDAEPDARIYAGLRRGVTRERLEASLSDGTLTECLHSFVPAKGDCVYLPAGTVHAAGGGLLIAEVQQSSDITFRLFDWNRPGPDGMPRPLHVQEALRCIHWPQGPMGPVVPRPISTKEPGVQGEHLVSCRHFTIDRFRLVASMETPHVDRMSVWMVLEGAAELTIASTGYRRLFRTGETVVMPAAAQPVCWTPSPEAATLLAVSVAMHKKRPGLPRSAIVPDATVVGLSGPNG